MSSSSTSSASVASPDQVSVQAPTKFPLAKRKRDGCECGAVKEPLYGLAGDLLTRWCAKCKDVDAVNIVKSKCECGNTHWPQFASLGSNKVKWCAKCPNKPDDAVDIKHTRCECKKSTPTMGSPTDKAPKYCSQCPRLPKNAISFYKARCHCGKVATFGLQENGQRKWCKTHRQDDAIDVVNRKCRCGKSQPHFGMVGGTSEWCVECKVPDAVNLSARMCLKCRTKQGCFTIAGSSEYWCSDCKPTDAKRIYGWCVKCNEKAGSWGPKDGSLGKRVWCAGCKEIDAISDHHKCRFPSCESMSRKFLHDGYCSHCFCYLFPHLPVAQNYKTKERVVIAAVKKFLESKNHIATFDRQIPNGTSRRRPDAFIDCKTHCIVIECDEFGHDTEEYCACENKRMMEIFQDAGYRPIIFLRLNPDAYINAKGRKVASCFKLSRSGKMLLEESKGVVEMERRLKTLHGRLEHHYSVVPDRELTVEHLYYNGFH